MKSQSNQVLKRLDIFYRDPKTSVLGGLLIVAALASICIQSKAWGNPLGAVGSSLLLGMILGNLKISHRVTQIFGAGLYLAESKLLYFAIFLMGIKLDLVNFSSIGSSAILTVLFSVISGLGLAILLGRFLLPSKALTTLIAVGTAICGTSAIAATAPLIKKENRDVALAIALVNLMGFLGMFMVPMICNLLDLTATASSFLIGSSLQAVGQVVAAGFSLGDQIGDMAVLIKMGRVALLMPLLVILTLSMKGRSRSIPTIPIYLIGFCLMVMLRTGFDIPDPIIEYLGLASTFCLSSSMVAIGLRMRINQILADSKRLLSFGLLLMLLHIAILLLWVYFLID